MSLKVYGISVLIHYGTASVYQLYKCVCVCLSIQVCVTITNGEFVLKSLNIFNFKKYKFEIFHFLHLKNFVSKDEL